LHEIAVVRKRKGNNDDGNSPSTGIKKGKKLIQICEKIERKKVKEKITEYSDLNGSAVGRKEAMRYEKEGFKEKLD